MTRRCTAWMPCRVGRSLVHLTKVLAELEARGVHFQTTEDGHQAHSALMYSANGQSMNYVVRLISTVPRYGGRRWWFLYPLARNDGKPPRRVPNLHLHPGDRKSVV